MKAIFDLTHRNKPLGQAPPTLHEVQPDIVAADCPPFYFRETR